MEEGARDPGRQEDRRDDREERRVREPARQQAAGRRTVSVEDPSSGRDRLSGREGGGSRLPPV
jgi:hypothetical protein